MKKIFLLVILLFAISDSVNALIVPTEYALNKDCPAEKPFADILATYFSDLSDLDSDFSADLHCIGCDTLHEIKIADGHEKDFKICSNREITKKYDSKYSILKKCPTDAPMRAKWGACISCSETDFVVVDIEECNKCPNRVSFEDKKYVSNICELKKCPADKPLKDDYMCLSCNIEGKVLSVNQEICEKCPDTYRWYQKKCVPIKRTGYKGEPLLNDLSQTFRMEDNRGMFYGSVGCKSKAAITTTEENCNQCANRKYIDGKCLLKEK